MRNGVTESSLAGVSPWHSQRAPYAPSHVDHDVRMMLWCGSMNHDPDLTEEELVIWRAAYGAAFAADFERNWRRARERPLSAGQHSDSFDVAARATDAQYATIVADAAVFRLRDFRHSDSTSDREAGLRLGQLRLEWMEPPDDDIE
jgi:hypothetical protein